MDVERVFFQWLWKIVHICFMKGVTNRGDGI